MPCGGQLCLELIKTLSVGFGSTKCDKMVLVASESPVYSAQSHHGNG